MGQEVKEEKKRPNNIGKYLATLTDEERAALKKKAQTNMIASRKRRREAIAAAKIKAEAMLPEVLAQDLLLLDNDQYTPRPEVLSKIKDLMDSGLSMEQLRKKHFSSMSEKGWDRLTKHLFKGYVATREDLGVRLAQSQEKHLKALEKHIKMIRKEIKIAKKFSKEKYGNVKAPVSLIEQLSMALKEYREYDMAWSKTVTQVAMDTGKTKTSASIHIHTSIPRPKPVEKEIEAKATRLDDLIG